MRTLNDREVATILHALRLLHVGPSSESCCLLDKNEIDSLCESISLDSVFVNGKNTAPSKTGPIIVVQVVNGTAEIVQNPSTVPVEIVDLDLLQRLAARKTNRPPRFSSTTLAWLKSEVPYIYDELYGQPPQKTRLWNRLSARLYSFFDWGFNADS